MFKPTCNLCSVKQTFSYSDKGKGKVCVRCSPPNMLDINLQPYFEYLVETYEFPKVLQQQIRNELFGFDYLAYFNTNQ